MITQPLPRHAVRTQPIPTPRLPWLLSGWGVALLGIGLAGLVLLVGAVGAAVAGVVS